MAATGVTEGLIGRASELARLDGLLDAAATRSQQILLEGEPGIGKTTLWRTAVELARARGFRVLTARPAEAEATLSFCALGDLLSGTTETIRALPDLQRRGLRLALLMEEHEKGAATDSRLLAVALLGLLRELARDTPVLVAVDDAQWLDPPTAALLTFAFRRVESERISFLGATRPGATRIALEESEAIAIEPLDVAAVDAIVRRTLDTPLPRPLLKRIGGASGGNPFYAVELARLFAREGPKFESSALVPLPPSLSDLLRSRIDALPSPSRRALTAVAALARPTRQLIERAVAGDARRLDAAIEAGIIEVDGEALAFTHPLLASAVVADIDPPTRRLLHARLAEVVSDREERARHLALAAQPPDEDVAAALEDAAQRAFERGATESAAELTEHAVRFTPAASVEAFHRRQLAAVGYLARTGAKARARELLREAESVATTGPDRARIALTGTWFGVLTGTASIEALRRAVVHARDDRLLSAQIHSMLVSPLIYSLDIAAAQHHAAMAVGLAEEVGDDALVVLARLGVVHAAFDAGEGVDLEEAERLVALEAVVGNPYGNVGVTDGFLARARIACGELAGAREVLQAKATEEQRRGDVGVAWALQELAEVEIRTGDWERAQAYAEESLELGREADDALIEAFALGRLTGLAVLRGEVARARELGAEALGAAEQASTPLTRARIRSHLGLLELSLDHAEAAASHFEEVAGFLAEAGFGDPDAHSFVPDQVEALIATGDLAQAEAAYVRFASQASRLNRRPALALAARCRGLLEAARRDLDAAAETLAEAHARAAELGHPFLFARTMLVEGTILRRAKRIAEARERLGTALATFERLGADLWAERTRRELARLGGRPSQSGLLTRTEEQIAHLVVSGKSNTEVARVLHVSPKTVEWNLSKVYKKLRVTSRTELAAKLAKQRD